MEPVKQKVYVEHTMTDEIRRCTSCKKIKLIESFSLNKKTGIYYKGCDLCRSKQKAYLATDKGKVTRRVTRKIYASKQNDIRRGYDISNNYIDVQFIIDAQKEQGYACIYCDVIMQLLCKPSSRDLLTIERIDNSIGHTKSNCVLACYRCNILRSDRCSAEAFEKIMNPR